MNTTPNYQLINPSMDDDVMETIQKIGASMQTIDSNMKSNKDNIEQLNASVAEQLNEKAEIPTTGNVRGVNATDFQFERALDDQISGTQGSFIAGGANNKIQNIPERATNARYAYAEGYGNRVHEWYGHAEGSTNIVDGKIAHGECNTNLVSGNDSHGEGNLTNTGRRAFFSVTFGSEDAGDSLGVLNYVLIDSTEGDLTSFFPNKLTDNITTRYGVGAQKDVQGNIYANGKIPAVWSGDILVTANDLPWAVHPFAVVRGPGEVDIEYIKIAKSTYVLGTGTKVYYYGAQPFNPITCIYTSYSPILLGLGNSQHSEGMYTSASGYGAHAEGYYTRAWQYYTHAEGNKTKATGLNAHSEGRETLASGATSHAEGSYTKATGDSAHAENESTTASGNSSHAEGISTISSGYGSHAEGYFTESSAYYSHAGGAYSKTTRMYQKSYSTGKNTNPGDNQVSNIAYTKVCAGVGWFDVSLLKSLEEGKAYNFETMVIGRQSAGIAGTIGDTFAYKFSGCFIISSGAMVAIGTPERKLIGRSAGMTGDGLTTGVRMSWYSSVYQNLAAGAILRYDGETDKTFTVTTYSTIQEMGL